MTVKKIAIMLCALCCAELGTSFSSPLSTMAGGWNRLTHGRFVRSTSLRGSTAQMSTPSSAGSKGKLLVLGGTGFVGSEIVRQALGKGYDVVALSRRGGDADAAKTPEGSKVDWRKGDASSKESISEVLAEGGFTGVVHAIGMLFESDLNRFASGSGSLPSAGATYDVITRQTAFNAVDALVESPSAKGAQPPFAFVSAAEARWDFDQNFKGTPAEWLHRYLIAKRAVESKLIDEYGSAGAIRPIIVRPSLVWTASKPESYLPVGAFILGNKLGLPFVDKPVTVQLLARSVLNAIESGTESGIFDYKGMERLGKP